MYAGRIIEIFNNCWQCIHLVSQSARKPVYTMLNSCNCVILMTDMYLTIEIQHNTVVYLTLNCNQKVESTALKLLSPLSKYILAMVANPYKTRI
jgi:hypothetical protein